MNRSTLIALLAVVLLIVAKTYTWTLR